VKAVRILGEVFLKNTTPDLHYRKLTEDMFLIGVNCTDPAGVCFCGDMESGPYIREGADLTITELESSFLIRALTPAGRAVLEGISSREPLPAELEEERRLLLEASEKVRGHLRTEELPQKLLLNLKSDYWQDVAKRCLACGSCTMVCPTCFCYDVVEELSADGSSCTRVRRWDVCFREGFSAIHGVPLRASVAARYRQWLMHKFSYWTCQFGTFGCVGCGRCIVWCPVGIDIREEVRNASAGDQPL